MYQISDDEIKRKDFSLKFPWLIDRIVSVSEVLIQQTDSSLELTIPALNGLGYTLDDVKEQLLVVNDSLYGVRCRINRHGVFRGRRINGTSLTYRLIIGKGGI